MTGEKRSALDASLCRAWTQQQDQDTQTLPAIMLMTDNEKQCDADAYHAAVSHDRLWVLAVVSQQLQTVWGCNGSQGFCCFMSHHGML